MEFPDKKYNIVYADPPWQYERNGGKSAEREYQVMSTQEIKDLPINKITKDEAHLYLWVTNPFMKEGLEVCEAWGFEYKTLITWLKTYQDGTPVMGMGYYFRGCTEHIIFGVKGKKLCENNKTRNIIIDRATKHSEKPIDVKKIIVECSGDLPRIELFSRPKYDLLYDDYNDGWDIWGNEV